MPLLSFFCFFWVCCFHTLFHPNHPQRQFQVRQFPVLLLFDWFWFTKPVYKTRKGREIARVVIVACHDPPMSNYANTCVIPKSTNHKFSGYQSYTINTVMYTSPLYPFVPFLMFFYLYKRVSMGLSVWRETSKKLTVCREKGKKLTVCRELFLFR